METFSALLVTGEFPAQRPVRRIFGVLFDLDLPSIHIRRVSSM